MKLCELIRDYFEPMGFDLEFAHTGPEGLQCAATDRFDAIILDVMLPGLDGFQLLGRLRTTSTAPVVMLTARGEDTDRVVGLEMGADDYVPKTSSTRELLARIRAVLRRAAPSEPRNGEPTGAGSPIEINGLRVDPSTHTVHIDGALVPLTPVEFGLLQALVRGRGRVLSRESLLAQVSDRELDVFDRSIDVHVSSLRRKLGDDSRNPRFIQTVRAAGYRLVCGDA
ncbi:MAG: response regulator transcription factor [Bryobacteraceae bacterium]